jgi:hypothetical protein
MTYSRSALESILLTAIAVGVSIGAAGCGTQPAGATSESPPAPTTPVIPSATAAKLPLRPGTKTVAQERAGDRPFDKTFDDIRFDMKPEDRFHRSMLTPAIEAMAGERIRIRGFILPTAQQRGIKQFVLVRDNQQCCFGPGAALFDCILVEMKEGKVIEYTLRPVAVSGTFDIREFKGPDDRYLAIYHLESDGIE